MPIFGAKSRAARGCASKLACGHRIGPAECNCKIARIFGDHAQRSVGADDPVRPLGTTVLPQRIVKTVVSRVGRARHRPLQTFYGFALVHSCSQVRAAGRTEASAPTGAYHFAWVRADLRRCAAGRLRKYYHITDAGRQRIEEFQGEWEEILAIYRFVTKGEDGK